MSFIRASFFPLLIMVLPAAPATAQRFIRNPPSIDTVRRNTTGDCDTNYAVQHWSARVKYPVGSERLATRANDWLRKEEALDTSLTGLISFRFLVDCAGQPSGFLCEQSTLDWEPAHFPEAVVMALYRFVLSLAPMPVGRYLYEGRSFYEGPMKGQPVNYYTYFSFVLKNGKVQSVAP